MLISSTAVASPASSHGMEVVVAVREFTDETGTVWRAWEIRPEAIHPRVKAEDYLADCYETGWLVFETTDGRAKRRLCPYPNAWHTFPENHLRRLLDRSDAVSPSKGAQTRQPAADAPPTRQRHRGSDTAASAASGAFDLTDLEVVRSFRYPGGRIWSVSVVPRLEDSGPLVLRFTAGTRSIDLRHWPRDWPDYPDDHLIELLRLASHRRSDVSMLPGTPRRRYTDPRT